MTCSRMLDANVIGLVNTARAFAPGLLAAAERGAPADFVVISSIGAHISFPGYAMYTATKAAATQFAATSARSGARAASA